MITLEEKIERIEQALINLHILGIEDSDPMVRSMQVQLHMLRRRNQLRQPDPMLHPKIYVFGISVGRILRVLIDNFNRTSRAMDNVLRYIR